MRTIWLSTAGNLGCDTTGHLARDCPEKAKAGCRIFSFAYAVRGGFSGRSRGPETAPEVQAVAEAFAAWAAARDKALKLILDHRVRKDEEWMEEEVVASCVCQQ